MGQGSPRAARLAIIWQGVLLVVAGVIVLLDAAGSSPRDAVVAVRTLAWVNSLAFLISLFLLRGSLGGFWNPVVLSSVFVFLFSSGQVMLHAADVPMLTYNLFDRLSLSSIRSALQFLIPGFAAYQLGVLLAVRKNSIWRAGGSLNSVSACGDKVVERAGLILVLVGIVPYGLFLVNNLTIVRGLGYLAYYQMPGLRLSSAISGLGYYLLAGLALLVVGGSPRAKRIAIAGIVVIAILRLVAGDRGEGFVYLLAAYLLHVSFVGRTRRLTTLSGSALGLLLVYSVSLVGAFRMNLVRSGGSLATLIGGLTPGRAIVSTLENLGGTLLPLVRVMELVPLYQSPVHGGSYLASLILLIPSALRVGVLGDIASRTILSSPPEWLMSTLNMSFGPGFSPFAEAYLNFGWGGIAAMFVYGVILTRLVSPRAGKRTSLSLAKGLGILAFMLFAMASRGSVNFIAAFYLRYVLVPWALVILLRSTDRKRAAAYFGGSSG